MKFLCLMLFSLTLVPHARAQVNTEDQEILSAGRISTGRYVGGGITGTLLGFGIGHGVVGHGFYPKRGWVFTVSELVGGLTMVSGFASCHGDFWSWGSDFYVGKNCSSGQKTAMAFGALIYYGFRIWEIVDIWTSPLDHNDRYDELKGPRHSDKTSTSYYLMPMPSLSADKFVWTAGLSQRF